MDRRFDGWAIRRPGSDDRSAPEQQATTTSPGVAKRNLAPAPSECWIVANALARPDARRRTKAIVRDPPPRTCSSPIAGLTRTRAEGRAAYVMLAASVGGHGAELGSRRIRSRAGDGADDPVAKRSCCAGRADASRSHRSRPGREPPVAEAVVAGCAVSRTLRRHGHRLRCNRVMVPRLRSTCRSSGIPASA